ncbi:hypothetical protein BAUCODRAFT_554995 [Baudoinia panamericana UAMH 10762]|uniref:Uncharacterized protein n=1 Tax=Baudoinia panamericana (strain UAMH 10762) TaxID=717646 RepID=M2LK76_BAUPA|nr:uncharacterized protein BAUCODRAFT_554995 [Baudoinia panamericana UAMH 10762]EMC94652.1 hypothetical protein BAUCODRAFT_554995 [Baudoinia panamericana UAMH 10762]
MKKRGAAAFSVHFHAFTPAKLRRHSCVLDARWPLSPRSTVAQIQYRSKHNRYELPTLTGHFTAYRLSSYSIRVSTKPPSLGAFAHNHSILPTLTTILKIFVQTRNRIAA